MPAVGGPVLRVPFAALSDRPLGHWASGHHYDRTHHRWQLQQVQPGRYLWTAPTGHTYQVDPEIVGLLAHPGREPAGRPRPTGVLST